LNAQGASFKSWVHCVLRPHSSSLPVCGMSETLSRTLEELGVTKLVFIRHANASPIVTGESRGEQPHDWKMRDQVRGLTAKGKEQCESSKSYLEPFAVKANLTSPARRATETALNMVKPTPGGDIFLRMIEGIHPAGMSAKCEDLFDNLGYGPLRKFFDAEEGKDAFIDYAQRVCAEMSAKIGGPSFERDAPAGDTICVFGHAVFLNAIAFTVGTSLGVAGTEDLLLDIDLGETQGIYIDIGAKSIVHLKVE